MSCDVMFSPDLQSKSKRKIGVGTTLGIKAPALCLQASIPDYRVNPVCDDTSKALYKVSNKHTGLHLFGCKCALFPRLEIKFTFPKICQQFVHDRGKKIGILISRIFCLKTGVSPHHGFQRIRGDAAGARGLPIGHPLQGSMHFMERDGFGKVEEVLGS
eukprot:5217530-Ditylum_brightwellii.AAC.1